MLVAYMCLYARTFTCFSTNADINPNMLLKKQRIKCKATCFQRRTVDEGLTLLDVLPGRYWSHSRRTPGLPERISTSQVCAYNRSIWVLSSVHRGYRTCTRLQENKHHRARKILTGIAVRVKIADECALAIDER
ncbi:hypothetical protein KCU65_g449, partial [Aureobasidium melanogenum]